MNTSLHAVPYGIEILHCPGEGYRVAAWQPGERRESVSVFSTLRGAFAFAEKVVTDAGFATALPGWEAADLPAPVKGGQGG